MTSNELDPLAIIERQLDRIERKLDAQVVQTETRRSACDARIRDLEGWRRWILGGSFVLSVIVAALTPLCIESLTSRVLTPTQKVGVP